MSLTIIVRLGSRTSNEFIRVLNEKNDKIQQKFLSKMTEITKMKEIPVMLGDSTITVQKTFEPTQVENFFNKVINQLNGWSIQNIAVSNNEDIRRIFTKFETIEGNYIISGHLSTQFHVLLYYKPNHRVIECQKELSSIIDLTKDKEQQIAENSDQLVLNKLKNMGYQDFDQQRLFEIFYENEELLENIYKDIDDKEGIKIQKLSERKIELFKELDSLLIETYQITPVLIDDTRLVTGEEGVLCTFDIEFIRNKTKEGLFDPRKISESTKKKIIEKLDMIYIAIKN